MNQIDTMKQALEALEGYEGRRAKDILRQAAPAQTAVPHGWKLAPIEPTEAMVIKFAHVFNVTDQSGTFRPAYRAMLSASPTAPAEIDFLQHDDHLRFIQRVLESDSPKSDRDEAAQMVRDIRRSIRPTAPAQQPLTDEQVFTLIHTKHFDLKYHLLPSDEVCLNWYRLGIRDGEAAHGIKGAKHD
jgi:hypothetical protein